MRTSALALMLPVMMSGSFACRCEGDAPGPPAPVSTAEGPSDPVAATTTDAKDNVDTSRPGSGDVADDEPPIPSPPAMLVAAMERALEGVLNCPRAPGGLRVANPPECLRPVQVARSALVRGPGLPEEKRAVLRRELSRVLLAAVSREEPTLVLYALKHHQGDFGPEANEILEKRMNDYRMDIAVAAATARFARPRKGPESAISIASSYLSSGRPDRLRAVACGYLGDPVFAGDRTHFDLLRSRAQDTGESALIRGCAARQLGNIASTSDIRVLSKLLEDPGTQSAAAAALVTGLGSPRAFSAVVRWLNKQTKDPRELRPSTVSRLLPGEEKMSLFPLDTAAAALRTIVINPDAPVATRLATVKAIAEMETWRERMCMKRGQTQGCPDPEETLTALLKKTEGSTSPNDLRVRGHLSRTRAELGASPADSP